MQIQKSDFSALPYCIQFIKPRRAGAPKLPWSAGGGGVVKIWPQVKVTWGHVVT